MSLDVPDISTVFLPFSDYQHQKLIILVHELHMKVFFLFHTNITVQCSSLYFIVCFVEQQNDIAVPCLMQANVQLHQIVSVDKCVL